MDDASFKAIVASVPKGTPNRWKTIAEQVGLPIDEVRKRAQPYFYSNEKLREAAEAFPNGTPFRWKLIAEQVGLPEAVVRKRLQSSKRGRRRDDARRRQGSDEDGTERELEQEQAWYTANDNGGDNTREGLPAISQVEVTLGKVLVLSDEYECEIEEYFYAKSIVKSFRSAGYCVEVWKLGFEEVTQALQEADFNILFILGAEIYDEYEFFSTIRKWVRAGGLLFLNGDGPNMNIIFEEELNLDWSTADYGRLIHKRREFALLPDDADDELFLESTPRTYPVEACLLDAPYEHQIYGANLAGISPSQNGLCAIASTPVGDGGVVFFGDVNAQNNTLNILISLCLGYERYPLCATCRRSDSSSDTKLLRCSKCNQAHYCDRSCQKKHWRTHKAVCSTDGVAQRVSMNASGEDLNVTIPPSVVREEAEMEYDHMMLAQTLNRDLAVGRASRVASARGAGVWDAEDEDRDTYAFTERETIEMIAQGYKPWDDDAGIESVLPYTY